MKHTLQHMEVTITLRVAELDYYWTIRFKSFLTIARHGAVVEGRHVGEARALVLVARSNTKPPEPVRQYSPESTARPMAPVCERSYRSAGESDVA